MMIYDKYPQQPVASCSGNFGKPMPNLLTFMLTNKVQFITVQFISFYS